MSASSQPALLDADFERLLAACFTAAELRRMPPEEKRERRRMFFAGARSLFRLIEDGIEADGPVTESEEAFSEAIEAELERFGADLEAGRA